MSFIHNKVLVCITVNANSKESATVKFRNSRIYKIVITANTYDAVMNQIIVLNTEIKPKHKYYLEFSTFSSCEKMQAAREKLLEIFTLTNDDIIFLKDHITKGSHPDFSARSEKGITKIRNYLATVLNRPDLTNIEALELATQI